MRTITLELLRHGPAHNQLLSPLTPYLALCENHGAVTLHVSFEHAQLLHRLSALSYDQPESARRFQLQDTAREMGEILARIPGLTAETNKPRPDGEQLSHLRLVISATELALLPFELALAPSGCPGTGQNLALQPQAPLCVTREVRRAPDQAMLAPDTFKILFAVASPNGLSEVPLEAHLLALRQVITPWVRYYDDGDTRIWLDRIAEHLVVLPSASIEDISNACATGVFTHVHILAHGVQQPEVAGNRFFLALHNARDRKAVDYISGQRLAAALRTNRRPLKAQCRSSARPGSWYGTPGPHRATVAENGLAQPMVVSLASCDSGNVGSVIGAGASIAHDLHEAGIPMVVAGQFPLSFEGSVRLTEVLYEGLLWGEDPRWLTHDLRRRLYAEFPHRHDWASLTVYASFPSDFDSQLSEMQIRRAKDSIDAAMNQVDAAISRTPGASTSQEKLLDDAYERIRLATCRLEALLRRLPSHRERICGLLGSSRKRQAELVQMMVERSRSPEEKAKRQQEVISLLMKARDHYRASFQLDRANSWSLVQHLSLKLLLRQADAAQPSKEHLRELWTTAHVLSKEDLLSEDPKKQVWARGNLIELCLLAACNDLVSNPEASHWENEARKAAEELVRLAGREAFEVYSTRRQILRYTTWYPKIAGINEPAQKMAEALLKLLPEEVEQQWR